MWCLIIVEWHILVLCHCRPAVHSFISNCVPSIFVPHSFTLLLLRPFLSLSFILYLLSSKPIVVICSFFTEINRPFGHCRILWDSRNLCEFEFPSPGPFLKFFSHSSRTPTSFDDLQLLSLIWRVRVWQTLCRPPLGQSSTRWTTQRKSVLTCCIPWATHSTQSTVLSHLARHPCEIPSVNFSPSHQGIFDLIQNCLSSCMHSLS